MKTDLQELNDAYTGWNTDNHLETFDFWNSKAGVEFEFVYGNFRENAYLKDAVSQLDAPTICDVGCATGTTFRYLSSHFNQNRFQYRGIDLSGPAIEKAKKLYPGGNFERVDTRPPKESLGRTYDIVYSRDTVLHQETPWEYLGSLIDLAEKFLVLRLRTRDQGGTFLDTSQSCQLHYDQHWMPYIVLNTDELIKFIAATGNTKRITINRSYEVLGGHNYRVLPKELYFTSAGGSETSLLIEFEPGKKTIEPVINFEDVLEGQAFQRKHRMKRIAGRLLSKILRPGKQA